MRPDPDTGARLGYLPPEKGPYEGGRAYVLYAAGRNMVDDGGRVDFKNPYNANKPDGDGDFLLNRWTPAAGDH